MWLCPTCAHVPKNPNARFCERCGEGLVEPSPPEEVDTLPKEFDTDLSLPNVASIAGDVENFMQTSEMGAAQIERAETGDGEPQSLVAVRLTDAQQRAVRSGPVDVSAWKDWEGIHPLPGRLRVDNRDWQLIGGLDVGDPESAAKFLFEVRDASVVVRESGEGVYPRGAKVVGRGLRHQGGCVIVTIGGLMPGAPLVMVRQSLAIGVETAEVTIGDDDEIVAEIRTHEVDPDHVWRNRATLIEALDVLSQSMELRIHDVGSNPGMTWFNVWFYQPSST